MSRTLTLGLYPLVTASLYTILMPPTISSLERSPPWTIWLRPLKGASFSSTSVEILPRISPVSWSVSVSLLARNFSLLVFRNAWSTALRRKGKEEREGCVRRRGFESAWHQNFGAHLHHTPARAGSLVTAPVFFARE